MESQGVASEDPAISLVLELEYQSQRGWGRPRKSGPPNQHELRASELTETEAPCTGPAQGPLHKYYGFLFSVFMGLLTV